jgi:hypothetical protein
MTCYFVFIDKGLCISDCRDEDYLAKYEIAKKMQFDAFVKFAEIHNLDISSFSYNDYQRRGYGTIMLDNCLIILREGIAVRGDVPRDTLVKYLTFEDYRIPLLDISKFVVIRGIE